MNHLMLPTTYQRRIPKTQEYIAEGQWQKDVYDWAFQGIKPQRLVDIGCGIDTREEYGVDVLGVDLAYVQSHRPNITVINLECEPIQLTTHRTDLIVCADVLEHLVNPVPLIQWLAKAKALRVVVSTPDRSLLQKGKNGPPNNHTHAQEWTAYEFTRLLEYYGFYTRESKYFSPQPGKPKHCFGVFRHETDV